MDYDSALSILKSSFSGGGEGDFYISRLRELHGMQIDWLDIGIGKGARSIQPFIDCLVAGGNTMRIIGIDPDARQSSRDLGDDRCIEIISERFERYAPDRSFDVINADQSLYYVEDLDLQLRRIAAALKPGGCFFATCWSEDCVLYHLRRSMLDNRNGVLTGEALIARMQDLALGTNVALRIGGDIFETTGPSLLNAALRENREAVRIVPHPGFWGVLVERTTASYNEGEMHWSERQQKESLYW